MNENETWNMNERCIYEKNKRKRQKGGYFKIPNFNCAEKHGKGTANLFKVLKNVW